jgi:light-regulated signal transduction histidine kinase (bacteriophytochrome)
MHEQYAAILDAPAQKYLQRISDAARRMSALIDDLIRLARVSRKGLSLAHVRLRSIVDEVLTDLESETRGRNIEWRIAKLPQIRCDRGLMKQVLVNLLSNSIKYTRLRSEAIIEIGQTVVRGQSAFFVRDNGVGFDMNAVDKLFAHFQRLHHEAQFEGTGIGLATVQRIIEKHKGRVWARSNPNSNTTFFFTLWESEMAFSRERPGEFLTLESAKGARK